ncbi:MAG: OmpA family protein [Alphaproteobacteria bacterium]|nr:OmpA family protein [Alphaproteobacteria bacterium]
MSNGVAKLKELLFENESRALTDLQRRIEAVAKVGTDQRGALARDLNRIAISEESFRREVKQQLDEVFERAGTQERFTTSVATVLDQSLAKAEVERHDQLSEAIAPLVVRTIKREIHESQDELVEALYPITGRLVQAYVASAMREVTERINRQLTANPSMLRVQSLMTGRSMAELALARSQDLDVQELYLIRRGSGELIARWPDVEGSPDRDQVMSGILTAINEFSLEAFNDDASTLRQIDLNSAQVYLRASPRLLLAAKCSGVSNATVERIVDEEFIAALERQHDQWDELATSASSETRRTGLLSEVAEGIETRVDDIRREVEADNSGWLIMKLLGWLLALLLAGWLAWAGYKYATTEWVRERANTVISETQSMRGYPVRLTVADYGTGISLAGLAPSQSAKSEIIANLENRLSGTTVDDQLTVVPTGPDATPQIAGLKQDLSALSQRLERQAFERSTQRTIARLEMLPPDLSQLQQNVTDAGDRQIVESARQAAATVKGELQTLLDEAAPGGKLDESSPLIERLAALRSSLAQQALQLSGLLATNEAGTRSSQPSAPPSTTAGNSLVSEAEAMAVQTEQFATLVAALSQASSIKPPPPPPPVVVKATGPTPREKLAAWTQSHAIFFSTGARFRNPRTASAHLDELARLMKATNVTVRVVGFTDEKGNSRQNSPLSQDRADNVKRALVSRGIPARRLVAIGRVDAKDISTVVGESSPNRRVEFEIGFVGE